MRVRLCRRAKPLWPHDADFNDIGDKKTFFLEFEKCHNDKSCIQSIYI